MGKQTKSKVSLVEKKRSKQREKKKRKTDREREREKMGDFFGVSIVEARRSEN